MDLTAQDIIVDALSLVGAVQMDQTPPAWEMNKALRALNLMLNSWSAQKLMVRAMTQESKALTVGDPSYTIGVGADINTAKPLAITKAFIRDSGGNDYQLEIITKDQYDSFTDKATSGMPTYLCYDPGLTQQSVQTGTIYLYNAPNVAYTLYFSSQKFLTEIAALTTDFTFEPQYGEAIKYNLAIRLWPYYRKPSEPVTREIGDIAVSSKRTIQTLNSTQVKATMDIPARGGIYNIYTDE